MELGGFETVTQKDENGWTAAHHAIDGSSYCRCAFKAALELICETPTYVLCSQTTGSQPKGNNCLHLACDGSDRFRKRCELVALMTTKFTSEVTQTQLVAALEEKDDKGNTAFLKAVASGQADVAQFLTDAGCDIFASNHNGCYAYDCCPLTSTECLNVIRRAGCWVEPDPDRVYGRTRGTHVGKEKGDRYRPLGPEAPLHESALMCCSFRFFCCFGDHWRWSRDRQVTQPLQ